MSPKSASALEPVPEPDPSEAFKAELTKMMRAAANRAGFGWQRAERGRIIAESRGNVVPEVAFDRMFKDLAGIVIDATLLRMRVSRLRQSLIEDPEWNIRRHIRNPKVDFGKGPHIVLGSSKEWVTDRRYFRATRVKKYTFALSMGEVDSNGRYVHRLSRRIQGWARAQAYARQWLTGEYDDAKSEEQRAELGRKRRAAVNNRWHPAPIPQKTKPKKSEWRSPTPGGYFESLKPNPEYDTITQEGE